jgi:spermidine synthase
VNKHFVTAGIVCLVLFLFPLVWIVFSSATDSAVLFETDSLYHNIQITQHKKGASQIRCMRFSGRTPTNQSCIDLADPDRQVLEYSEMMFAGLLYNDTPKRVLVIGLGGGIIPTIFQKILPETKVDVVEIDKTVVKLAQEYFGFLQGGSVRVHVKDGRRFVARATEKYDMIFLDAFNGDQIPFHLMTREFFELLKANVLADDGVLVSNVFFNTELFDHQLLTYKKCFVDVDGFAGKRSGNVILVTLNQKRAQSTTTLTQKAEQIMEHNQYPHFDLKTIAGLYDAGFAPDKDAKVLTDDFAPVNYLLKKKR